MAQRAGLFDLRGVLALLFAIYGVVLTVMGIFSVSEEDLRKSGDINVNLWMGLGMLVTAALFFGWQRLRPLAVPEESAQAEQPGETGQARADG